MKPPIYRQCGQSGHRQFKSRNSYNCAQRYKGARGKYQREFRGARGGGYREKGTRGLYEEEQSLQTEDRNQENYVHNLNADQLRRLLKRQTFLVL